MRHLVFLGCGEATRMHSRTLRRLAPDVRRSYASRDGDRARHFAARLGGDRSWGSYQEALDDPESEVVLVATPPAHHLEWALAGLEAGKHVIVEKPAFLRSTDVDRVADLAAERGLQAMVAENYYYKPLARALRGVLRRGDVGRPLFLHINALKSQPADGWRRDAHLAGGGALFEGGIHWIDLLAHLGPEVTAVESAFPGGAEPGRERSVLVTLTYEGGLVASLAYSWEVPSLFRGLRISRLYGTEGSVTFESNGLFLASAGRRRRISVPGPRDLRGFRAMFTDFLGALKEGRSPRFTLAMARRDLELVEMAYRHTRTEARGTVTT